MIFPMTYEQLEFLGASPPLRNHESEYLEEKDEIGYSFAAELVQAQRTLALQRPFFLDPTALGLFWYCM